MILPGSYSQSYFLQTIVDISKIRSFGRTHLKFFEFTPTHYRDIHIIYDDMKDPPGVSRTPFKRSTAACNNRYTTGGNKPFIKEDFMFYLISFIINSLFIYFALNTKLRMLQILCQGKNTSKNNDF